jgi:hypothetical protein
MLFYLDSRQKKSYSEWILRLLSNQVSEEFIEVLWIRNHHSLFMNKKEVVL